MRKSNFITIFCVFILMSFQSNAKEKKIDWPVFMHQHDMTFSEFPAKWNEAPHFGNAMIGSMLYKEDGCIRLEVFRADVNDHRDDSYGWPAYSRPHFRIGYFLLYNYLLKSITPLCLSVNFLVFTLPLPGISYTINYMKV